jgi:RHS repeat-associated protein
MAEQNANDLISLPKGGGALAGIGETFQPDLHTGTGNLRVPLPLPAGRGGLQPALALSYSTGSPNGPFGLGWALSVPGIRRRTSKHIPRYDDATDVFVLSGAEDLVPVPSSDGSARYRPRTETGYARITHVTGGTGDYWEVWSKDGLRSRYGTARPASPPPGWTDPAAVTDPKGRVFGWLISQTVDPLGNRIDYRYQPDPTGAAQRYLAEVRYADHGDPANPQYLISVRLVYDTRPDPFSDRRPGFELRTTQRAARIEMWTQAGTPLLATSVELTYADQIGTPASNSVSLLARIQVTGHDGAATQQLPPLEFGYTDWDPAQRRFQPLSGELPLMSLGTPGLDLVDLFGDGLPSVLELDGTARYWRNRGGGTFDLPRRLGYAPAGVALGAPGVQLADMDGDGRPELVVSSPDRTGYWPLATDRSGRAGFDPAGYVAAATAPTFGLSDPRLRLVDLDGDGRMDLLRAGETLELAYNDGHGSFTGLQVLRPGGDVPDVSVTDPRVRLADMTGDGLTDVVLLHDRAVSYWPNLGYGRWGEPVMMANPPRFDDGAEYDLTGFDPRRLLLGDVVGDGTADLVYVGDGHVTVWINQAGNGFAAPVIIGGTPRVSNASTLRLADLLGGGVAGVLWTADAAGQRPRYAFLDLTGGGKPYLLNRIDNHTGATTTISYATSTSYATADHAAGRPWRTTLPLPVQVISQVTVTDYFSGTTLTSEYDYHHGYWDGADREFRGFAHVDQRDTLNRSGPAAGLFQSPPTETRTWFHLGPVGPEFGGWDQLDLSDEYWQPDPPLAAHIDTSALSATMPRRGQRDAIRALHGQVLRRELHALDGSPLADRPYELADYAYALAPVLDGRSTDDPGWQTTPVVAVHPVLARTTVWERGNEPMTRAQLTGGYDDYGRPHASVDIAVPRGRDPRLLDPHAQPYLAVLTTTAYATRDDPSLYLVDRVSLTSRQELTNDGTAALRTFADQALAGTLTGPLRGLQLTYYDGPAFEGLPPGQLGSHGLPVRTEQLIITPEIITAASQPGDGSGLPATPPPYLPADGVPPADTDWPADYPTAFWQGLPPLVGYRFHPDEASYQAGYYTQASRLAYDIQTTGSGRGLVTFRRDPLGADTAITYDSYQLLPIVVTDPLGLTTTATYNYRVLHPSLVINPNGNRTQVTYTPLGLPASVAVLGKAGAREGDTADQPGIRYDYGLTAWDDSHGAPVRQPMWVHTTHRVDHRWTLVAVANAQRAANGQAPLTDPETIAMFPADERDQHPDRFLRTQEYTDGFGRLLQARAQADDIVLDKLGIDALDLAADPNATVSPAVAHQIPDPASHPSVLVSSWKTYDNKGRVVQAYEPLYDSGYAYLPPSTGQISGLAKTTTVYDPRGLAVLVIAPDGAAQLTIPGIPDQITDPRAYQPTPWESYRYDANDNAGRTHPTTTTAWSSHRNTPSSSIVDPLGRVISHTERTDTDTYTTTTSYDIDGNVLAVTDPLGRLCSHAVYDLAKRPWRAQLLDAGTTRTVHDPSGGVIEQRDDKGGLTLGAFDRAHRAIRLWAADRATEVPTLRLVTIFGDDNVSSGLTATDAAAVNALGRPVRAYDEAGLLVSSRYDLDGNLLTTTRRVLRTDVLLSGLPPSGGDWANSSYHVDWQPAAGQSLDQHANTLLDTTSYEVDSSYDALGRRIRRVCPIDTDGIRSRLSYQYGRSGALVGITLDDTPYLNCILYNARGQRTLALLGNGIMIRYLYDSQTFRLTRLRAEAAQQAAPLTWQGSATGAVLQDYCYKYDLVGNLLTLADRTPGSGIPPGDANAFDRAFSYDPLSRLLTATGRETDLTPTPPWLDVPRRTDPTKTRPYSETYTYDAADNLRTLTHQASTGYTRTYALAAGSDRLAILTVGTAVFPYSYDPAGNLLIEATTRRFEWDHANRCSTYRTQTDGADPSLYAQYRYDAAGQRTCKIVRNQGGQLAVTLYISGLFERLTLTDSTRNTVHDSIHVLDAKSRVAVIRRGAAVPGDSTPTIIYHLEDHLGSSLLVLDAAGGEINREEFTAFGETSFGSYARKRYRYAGKERDEETSLCYHGARYYAPWLCRWISCDIAGAVDGQNLYRYSMNRPTVVTDPSGLASAEAPALSGAADASATPTYPTAVTEIGHYQQQEGGGFVWRLGAPTTTPDQPSTDRADAGVAGPRTSGEPAELSWSLSAKASIKVGADVKRSASLGLKWSLVDTVGDLCPPTETGSYDPGSQSGTWGKTNVGSYKGSILTAGLSTSGPELTLLELGVTGIKQEYGLLRGDWWSGTTADMTLKGFDLAASLDIKDGSVGAEIGASLANWRGSVGFNLLGVNFGVYGEAGLSAKLGMRVGAETSIHEGPLGVGVTVGWAKGNDPHAGWANFFNDIWTSTLEPLSKGGHFSGLGPF